jgi:hypothetical protein
MEAVRTSETSVDNHFTRQYNPEDSSEHHTRRRENFKSHLLCLFFSVTDLNLWPVPEQNFMICVISYTFSIFVVTLICILINSYIFPIPWTWYILLSYSFFASAQFMFIFPLLCSFSCLSNDLSTFWYYFLIYTLHNKCSNKYMFFSYLCFLSRTRIYTTSLALENCNIKFEFHENRICINH